MHCSPQRRTDGVFRALTDARIAIPWITALRGSQSSEKVEGKPGPNLCQRDLTPKRMQDSFHRVVLPLAQDKWLSDTYLNASGNLRLGTVLSDLDALSGLVAYAHTGDGVTTVTAAVDRITIQNPLTEMCDLEYSGQVTFAPGRSSMEISCTVAKAPPEGKRPKPEDVFMTIAFTMVSLDPQTKKPVHIPAIQASSPEEEAIFKLGEQNSKRKKALASRSLLSHHPDPTESELIHRIWLFQVAAHNPHDPTRIPSNVHTMSSTKLQNASIMQPQYRNRHNFMIFGGFLLKQTFELAFCCCASFAHERPTFVSADPCTFLNPVPVGSVLYLTATVVYTDPPVVGNADVNVVRDGTTNAKTRVSIRVDTKVRDVEHGIAKPTGQFHYTFTVNKDVKVMPETYQEHMIYLDGRRRSEQIGTNVATQPAHV